MAYALLVVILRPKNVSIFRAHPFQNVPRNGFARIKIVTFRVIETTGTLLVTVWGMIYVHVIKLIIQRN